MAKRFDGKSVFITGGSSGIGAELGRQFAQEGAKVALLARRTDKLESVVGEIEGAGGTAIAVECDVTDRTSLDAAVERVVSEFGGIDVAVANAGFTVMGPILKLTSDDFRRQFEVNVFGVVDTLYAVLPHLRESGGRFGVIGSVSGRLSAPGGSFYSASKFAITGLCEGIYHELDDAGISLTLIEPGFVRSEIHFKDNKGELRENAKGGPPKALVMPTDKAARSMINAMYRRRPSLVLPKHGKVAVFLARHFPRTVRFFTRLSTRGRFKPRDTA